MDENGVTISYATVTNMATVSQRCFGGAPSACQELITREWDRVFGDSSFKNDKSND